MVCFTNANILKKFEYLNELKSNSDLDINYINSEVEKTHSEIMKYASFLVYSHAKQYKSFPNYDDLVQEGFIGLLRAIRKFDVEAYSNFFSYAEQWVKHCIKRSASRFDIVYNPEKSRTIYAENTDVLEETEEEDTPESVFFAKETSETIENALNEFSERDREIVKRIFGLSGHKQHTLREVGPVFDLTYERVRQIKNRVVSKLRKNKDISAVRQNGVV